MNKNEYMFGCLLKEFDPKLNALPYEAQFDLIKDLHSQYKISPYNAPNDDQYQSMTAYIIIYTTKNY